MFLTKDDKHLYSLIMEGDLEKVLDLSSKHRFLLFHVTKQAFYNLNYEYICPVLILMAKNAHNIPKFMCFLQYRFVPIVSFIYSCL